MTTQRLSIPKLHGPLHHGSDLYLPHLVLKFGGSSIADRIENVLEISMQHLDERPILVPSAIKGVTDALIELSDLCFEEVSHAIDPRVKLVVSPTKVEIWERARAIEQKYVAVAGRVGIEHQLMENLFGLGSGLEGRAGPSGLGKLIQSYVPYARKYFTNFYHQALASAEKEMKIVDSGCMSDELYFEQIPKKALEILLPDVKQYMRDKFALWGELPSARLVSIALCKRGLRIFEAEAGSLGLHTEMRIGGAEVLSASYGEIERTFRRLEQKRYNASVVGGYNAKGVVNRRHGDEPLHLRTTLGRGGSDQTAVVFGAALRTPVHLYSDTNGVYDGDPSLLSGVRTISELSAEEAVAIAPFAKVLYLRAMESALSHKVEVWSKNTFKPDERGTRIGGLPVNPGKAKAIGFLSEGVVYTVGVVGHDLGSSNNEIARVTEIVYETVGPSALQGTTITPHCITYKLSKETLLVNAQELYTRILR